MKTCLIVDDSRTVRKVVKRIIAGFGFDVLEAGNGVAALTQCQAKMPDVILLDWDIPVMDGLAFLKALRALPKGASPVVIFCTTVHELRRAQAALEAGADEYIMKPFDQEIIRCKLVQTGVI